MKVSAAPNKIDDINAEIEKCKRAEDWDGKDSDETLLFPSIKIPHLSRGASACSYVQKPGHTKNGEEFCLSAVMSTAALCNQLFDQQETVEFSVIEGADLSGLKLKHLKFPCALMDGFSSIIQGGTVFIFTTFSKNHHGKVLACGVTHEEQLPTAREALDSFSAGFKIAMRKLGHDEDKVNLALKNLHIASDDGPALKPAITQFLSENASHGSESSCSAHIHNDGLPKNKSKLNDESKYSLVCNHIKMLERFPCHAYGEIPWKAVKLRWHSMDEKSFCEWFENEHINKYANFRAGSVALGMPDDTNSLESQNEHKLKKMFTAVYRRGNPKRRLPIPLPSIIKMLREELLPSWSKDTGNAGWFETEFETTPAGRKLAKELMMDPFLLELGNGLWCARYVGKKTAPLSKSTARRALRLHEEAIRAHLDGKDDDIEWSWDDFKLASSVVFTSKDSCSCKYFLRKKICRDIMAVRELAGLDGLSIGVVAKRGDDIDRRQRGGNKRHRNKPDYEGHVHDRLVIAEREKRREATKTLREIRKRRREHQEELKVDKRPRTEFKCHDCGKVVSTSKGLKQHCTIKNHEYVAEENGGFADLDGTEHSGDEADEGSGEGVEGEGDQDGEDEGGDEGDEGDEGMKVMKVMKVKVMK